MKIKKSVLHKTCLECKKTEPEIVFASYRSSSKLCKTCWRIKHGDRMRANQRRHYYKNRQAELERQRKSNKKRRFLGKQEAYHISSPRRWLSAKMSNIRKTVKKYNREFNIDLDYLVSLWEKQDGKCAITNLPLTHEYNCPSGASPDRIDSKEGYIKGNVQLVCKAVNLAKNSLPNHQIVEWFEKIRQH